MEQKPQTSSPHTKALLGAALLLIGCGASYQSVYESDVRFEHCYAIDTSPAIAASAKLHCWSDWTKGFTVGQTRDRVDYALARQRALLAGDTLVPTAALTHTAVASASASASLVSAPVGSAPNIACPLPNSPFEPPPATLRAAASPASSPPAAPSASASALTSSQACVHDCGEQFTTCATACTRAGCVNRCGDLAKTCIAKCL